jgi:endonuclease/exonuclease/phosphatase family metal-dependent hydrolase
VRVATSNLLSGRALPDGAVRTEDLMAAARMLDADVIGLQEVDRHQERSGNVDQARVVAEAVGAANWRFVPALEGTPGGSWTASRADDGSGTTGPSYGIALLSRLPVLCWRVRRFAPAPLGLPLLVPGSRGLTHVADEPRIALAAVVAGPTGPVTVVTAHLSFVPGWNVHQVRAITRWARSLPGPRLLIGDLNLPGPVPSLVSGWSRLARVPTYPSWRPRVQLDHVLAERATRVAKVDAVRLPLSDHCALVVDVEDTGCLPPAGPASGPATSSHW